MILSFILWTMLSIYLFVVIYWGTHMVINPTMFSWPRLLRTLLWPLALVTFLSFAGHYQARNVVTRKIVSTLRRMTRNYYVVRTTSTDLIPRKSLNKGVRAYFEKDIRRSYGIWSYKTETFVFWGLTAQQAYDRVEMLNHSIDLTAGTRCGGETR